VGLSVSGTATMQVVPDTADLSLTLTAESARPGAAARRVRERQAAVQAAVQALSAAKVEVSLSHLSVQPLYDDKTRLVRAYQAAITLTLSTSDFDSIPELMEIGASQNATMASASFRTRDLTALKKQVRDQALAAVKDKATQMTSGVGVKLGRVVSISEDPTGSWSGYLGVTVPNHMSFQDLSSGGQLQADAQPLTLTITVGYELIAG
jgi:hypothetical protein